MKKHFLTLIGGLGDFSAYLDTDPVEAEKRFNATWPKEKHYTILPPIYFDDTFGVYDAWTSFEEDKNDV